MRSRPAARFLAPLVVLGIAACASGGSAQKSPLHSLPADDRRAAIRRAEVWLPVDVPSMDIRRGPKEPGAFEPFAELTCNFVDKDLNGKSAKFTCMRLPDDELRVKYGRDNGEVYAEVAASRLLWALGFGADRMYPVKVSCHGCPRDPAKDKSDPQELVLFDPATAERKMPGITLETKDNSGWSWNELDELDETAGPAIRTHRSALKLMAVFLQHTDSKPDQQRLVCLPDERKPASASECRHPFLMINDLGITFGRANLLNRRSKGSVNLEEWSKASVWKGSKGCEGNLPESFTGTLNNPVITEDGRKFLADLLQQLSDAQLRDLFEIARFQERSGAIDGWIAAFKHKRDEIATRTCSS